MLLPIVPKFERRKASHPNEIPVGCKHHQIMTDAQLRQKRIDRSDPQAGASTAISQRRGLDMIFAVRRQEWKRGESIRDLLLGAWSDEALQELLEHEAGCYDLLSNLDRSRQHAYFAR